MRIFSRIFLRSRNTSYKSARPAIGGRLAKSPMSDCLALETGAGVIPTLLR
jgi:hypothetical protein